MPMGQIPLEGVTDCGPEHQTYIRADLLESVVRTISGPQPETTQGRTQTKNIQNINEHF